MKCNTKNVLPKFSVTRQTPSSPPVLPGKSQYPILYAHTLCPYAERVFLALLEKNSGPFTLCHIDLADKPSWYRRDINARGLVPAIEFRGSVHVESLDLIRWVDQLEGKDSRSLKPPAQNEMEEIHLEKEMQSIIENGSQLVDAGLSLLAGSSWYWSIGSDASRSESSRKRFEKFLEIAICGPIRNHKKGPYLLGETVTMADIALFPFMKRFSVAIPEFCGFDIPEGAMAWLAAMMERPACRIVSADDELLLKAFRKHRSLDFFDNYSYDVWDLHPQNVDLYPPTS